MPDLTYDVFLSHSSNDKAVVRAVAERLRADGLRVWFDEWEIKAGDSIPAKIEEGLEHSRVLVLCMSANAFGSDWAELEAGTFRFRDPLNKDRRFIPLRLDDAPIKGSLAQFLYISWRAEDREQEYPKLLEACQAVTPPDPRGCSNEPPTIIPDPIRHAQGIIPAEQLHAASSRLAGEVFAIELLQRPIVIVRRPPGRYLIIIDRRGVRHAVITTEAKSRICRQYVKGREDELRTFDDTLHQFLLGKSNDESMTIDLPALGLPLRWASGGVMSVVTRANRPKEKWTPLFFRDINPWGWNLALGSCEREFDDQWKCRRPVEEELNDPSMFLLREFLEETLILSDPPKLGSPLSFKRFYFDRELADRQQRISAQFAKKHIDRRSMEDGLAIQSHADREIGFTTDSIPVHDVNRANMDILVIDQGGGEHLHLGFLVTFNLLELGIEVVRVFEYSIGAKDYFLDGELLVDPEGSAVLVRMPVALISHRALKRNFGPGSYKPAYTKDLQPSFMAGRIKKNEIRVFEWDIQERLKMMRSPTTPERQKERYRRWYERFGQLLLTKEEKFNYDNVPSIFIPGTAKVLSLYFSRDH